MSWTVKYLGNAQKYLKKTDKNIRDRLREAIESKIAELDDPRSLGRALKGEHLWRYRVGEYRVIVEIRDDELLILVITIGHRKDVYRPK